MQSYMNSLNESASMEMEVSPPPPPPDAPSSPQNQNHQTNEGSVSQPYRSNLINADEKPLKMAARTGSSRNNNNNNNACASTFQSSSVQEASLPHPNAQTTTTVPHTQANLTPAFHIATNCPVAPGNPENSCANANVDNVKYTFSSNQNQCPISRSLSPQSSYAPANHNSFTPSESQNQNSSCPWKLNGGAKVLVSNWHLLWCTLTSD